MDDLELIKQRINIVDLIQEYLPLKKSGVNFKALCPFHSEKTPSFMVSPERQIWHCFGCSRGGDHFKFLMEKEGMEFKEALEVLAKKAGVVLKRKAGQKKDFRERLFEVNLKAQEFFHYLLTKHQLGQTAKEYLKKRGVSDQSIQDFGLGYAPNSWESLSKFLLKRGFSAQELITSGLGVASKSGCYDRFRGRVTFPLIDTRDRILGFSGRVLGEDQGAGAKYINTPQTTIFDKSSFLFGIHQTKGEIRSHNEAILLEGEMDVILSYQAGVKHVVAVKGSALTQGQIELLKKYTENLSLCFDTDLAGDWAARRGIEIADMAGLNIKVVQIKNGKDAAEVVLKDPQQWQSAISEATPIYDYYLNSVSQRYDSQDPAALRKISQELMPIWVKISDDLVRDHYIQKLAALVRTDEAILRKLVEKQRQTLKRPTNYSQVFHSGQSDDEIINPRSRRQLLEEYLITLLLHIPKDHLFVPGFPETLLMAEPLRQIFVLLVLYLDSISFKGRAFNINEFAKEISKELVEELDRLYLTQLDEKLVERRVWQKEVDGVVAELKKALIKASLERLSLEIKNAESFGKIEMVEILNRRFRDLSVKLKNL
ncbi:DNA primase [Candidatus Daviesbacteria bacterium]|nr:DNA primase [Candidatus Daviesbacteria bacterium]